MEKIEAWETTDTTIFKYKEDAAKHEMEDIIWGIIKEWKFNGLAYRDVSDFIIDRKEDVKAAIRQYEDLMAEE